VDRPYAVNLFERLRVSRLGNAFSTAREAKLESTMKAQLGQSFNAWRGFCRPRLSSRIALSSLKVREQPVGEMWVH